VGSGMDLLILARSLLVSVVYSLIPSVKSLQSLCILCWIWSLRGALHFAIPEQSHGS
jgi:hypothetical protein